MFLWAYVARLTDVLCRLITVGPYISLDAKAQGHLALDLSADVHLAYDFKDLEMWYPKKEANLMKEEGIKSKDTGKGTYLTH